MQNVPQPGVGSNIPDEAAQKPGPQGSPSELLALAMGALMQVGEMMNQRPDVVPPEQLQVYAQHVAGLQKFMQQVLGSAPGGEAAPEQAAQALPAQGGAQGVPARV